MIVAVEQEEPSAVLQSTCEDTVEDSQVIEVRNVLRLVDDDGVVATASAEGIRLNGITSTPVHSWLARHESRHHSAAAGEESTASIGVLTAAYLGGKKSLASSGAAFENDPRIALVGVEGAELVDR